MTARTYPKPHAEQRNKKWQILNLCSAKWRTTAQSYSATRLWKIPRPFKLCGKLSGPILDSSPQGLIFLILMPFSWSLENVQKTFLTSHKFYRGQLGPTRRWQHPPWWDTGGRWGALPLTREYDNLDMAAPNTQGPTIPCKTKIWARPSSQNTGQLKARNCLTVLWM